MYRITIVDISSPCIDDSFEVSSGVPLISCVPWISSGCSSSSSGSMSTSTSIVIYSQVFDINIREGI